MSDDIITIAISRFIRAEKRVQGLSARLSDDEIVIAHEERTEALLGLIRWDKADPVAAAILALVRAQDRLQGYYDGICKNHRDTLTPDQEREEHDRALADREAAILQLMEAGLRAEDWNRRRAGSEPERRFGKAPPLLRLVDRPCP
jgi:hypothetical protein